MKTNRYFIITILLFCFTLLGFEQSAAQTARTGREVALAKLDSLEATAQILRESTRMDNKKFGKISNLHLRLVLELRPAIKKLPKSDALYQRFKKATANMGSNRGGDADQLNRNWVTLLLYYDEARDYEYTDNVYPFDQSNELPTANTKTDRLANDLMQ